MHIMKEALLYGHYYNHLKQLTSFDNLELNLKYSKASTGIFYLGEVINKVEWSQCDEISVMKYFAQVT